MIIYGITVSLSNFRPSPIVGFYVEFFDKWELDLIVIFIANFTNIYIMFVSDFMT